MDWMRNALVLSVFATFAVTAQHSARGGIGPENVIVVVNAESAASRTIANHYVDLRDIPSGNVVFLQDIPEGLTITLEEFKSRILLPLLNQLNARKLAPQTRTIAYSAGFPTSVNISDHTSRLTNADQKKYQLPTASLTGLTYFYQFMLVDSERYLDWESNLYARGPFERHFANPYLGGDRRTRFDEAIANRDAGQFELAANEFEKLFEESRTIAALGILAAEARANQGDSESAALLIEQAIAAGWSSGTYLKESEALSPLLEEPRLRRLQSLLNDYPTVSQEPVGFTASVGWTACGSPSGTLQDGVAYLTSCMLAVIHPRGSDIDQAVKVLETASTCDSTFPSGGFWFTYTKDSRTSPRFPQLGNALLWLKKSGHDAEIIHAALPTSKTGPCVGLMLGVADIPMETQKWRFVPGAIADNLTSYSGQFDTPAQTKITELLHAGAAMSCGPVFEPYNLPFKFPSPLMYGYYASGVSAIEAIYLSVTSPYQLLVIGDPLAQPFAKSPTDWVGMQIDQLEDGKRRVEFTRRRLPLGEQGTDTRMIEIYVEGRLVQTTPAVDRLQMSLPENLAGALEVRCVLASGGPIQSRASHVEWITLDDGMAPPEAEWMPDQNMVRLRCQGASSIGLAHHSEVIGSIEGAQGQLVVDRSKLGSGPLRLRPIAVVEGRRIPGKTLMVRD